MLIDSVLEYSTGLFLVPVEYSKVLIIRDLSATAYHKKTASEIIQKRFLVEVVGFEPKMQTPPKTLV